MMRAERRLRDVFPQGGSASASRRLAGLAFRLRYPLVLVLLAAVAWQWENYRVKSRLVTAGLSLDWRDAMRQAPVADEDNVAAHPPFDVLPRMPVGDSYFVDIESALKPLFEGIPKTLLVGKERGLSEWAETLDPAPESMPGTHTERVLAATAPLEPLIQDLHDALHRPACVWMELDVDAMETIHVPQISDLIDDSTEMAGLFAHGESASSARMRAAGGGGAGTPHGGRLQ